MIGLGISGGPEERSASYTDLAIAGLVGQAAGIGEPSAAQVRALAAVETCASLWGRALAGANVEPLRARRALPPDILEMIGRELFLRGEFAGRLAVAGSRLAVWPCSVSDVMGALPDPATWEYRITVPAPKQSIIETRPAGEVLHVRYGCSAHAPWRGIAPLQRASRDVAALAALMYRIGQEAGSVSGQLATVPGSATPIQRDRLQAAATGGPDTRGPAEGLNGGMRLLAGGKDARPFSSLRLGFDPSAEAREWAGDLERRIMNVAGVSPPMFLSASDGTAARESFRRFVATTVEHLGELVALEASAKLALPVALSFERLRGADVQGLGRAVKSLVDAGSSLSEALATVGLE